MGASRRKTLDGLCGAAPHRLPPGVSSIALPLTPLASLAGEFGGGALPADILRSVPRRRTSFVGGRLCAELALERLGLARHGVGRQEDRSPAWPEGAIGSITHTDTTAYAAVAERGQVAALGIDSEIVVDAGVAASILECCCTPHERDAWFQREVDPRLVTAIFSAKEALYKAIHPTLRRFIDFTEVEVESIAWSLGELTLRAAAPGPLAGRIARVAASLCEHAGAVHTAVWFRDLREAFG